MPKPKILIQYLDEMETAWEKHAANPKVQRAVATIMASMSGEERAAYTHFLQHSWQMSWLYTHANEEAKTNRN